MVVAFSEVSADLQIGERLRTRRRSKSLSLVELSGRVGISVGQLSEIERGLASPSLRTLRTLCQELGISMGWVLGDEGARSEDGESRIITRRDRRRRMDFGARGMVKEIVCGDLNSPLQVLLMEIRPGAGSGGQPYTHKGVEAGLVLSGAISLHVEGETHQLAEGDAFQFESDRPHHFDNPHAVPARVLWILSPAMY